MSTGRTLFSFHCLALAVAIWMPLAGIGCRAGKGGGDPSRAIAGAHSETMDYRLFDEWSSHQPLMPAVATSAALPSLPTDDIALVSLMTPDRTQPDDQTVPVLRAIPQPSELPDTFITESERSNDLPELSFHQAIAAAWKTIPCCEPVSKRS